jgi:class 3 adenylate cyclase
MQTSPGNTEQTATEILTDIDQARRRGDLLLAFDLAWSGVKASDQNLQLKYQAVLALARTGAHRGAEALYKRWHLNEQPDEDSQALAGRLVKDQALLARGEQRAALALRAAQLYESVWQRTKGYYPAINAATLYLLGKRPDPAHRLARIVLDILATPTAGNPTDAYYEAASIAEAELILGHVESLQQTLQQAARLRGDDWQLGSTTRNQLLLLCDSLSLPTNLLDPLQPPACAHFCGHIIGKDDLHPRFPAGQEARVREQMEQLIVQHNIRFGFGSAAAGADLMFAEALLDAGGEIHLVLPFEQEEFAQTSVASAGPGWPARFERCIDAAKAGDTLFQATLGGYQQDNSLFAYASHIAMGNAHLHAAKLGSRLLQVVVWDGIAPEPESVAGTGSDILCWRRHGGDTLVIDSRDPHRPPRRLPAIGIDGQGSDARSDRNIRPNTADTPGAGALPTRQLRAFLFGDIKGFTRLREEQLPIFQREVMGAFAAVLDEFDDQLLYRNTWGDALYVVFTEVGDAADCAARLQEILATLPLAQLQLPEGLSLRIGMHYGPVYEDRDQVLRETVCYGTEVSRAARIEPITPPGEIYATEAFAAALAFDAGDRFCADYVGRVQTAKNYGEFRMYHIRRSLGGDDSA